LLPWVAARHLYGPYTAFRRGEFGAGLQFTAAETAGLSRPAFMASVLGGPLLVTGLSLAEFTRRRRLHADFAVAVEATP